MPTVQLSEPTPREERAWEKGDYIEIYGEVYIIGAPSPGMYVPIGLNSGNRWGDPVAYDAPMWTDARKIQSDSVISITI